MAEYIERETVVELFNKWADGYSYIEVPTKDAIACVRAIPTADVIPASDFRDCRNELCLKCGAYTQKHLGACDGCRWRETNG